MALPSPDAKPVYLGKEYRPARFEIRRSDGTYSALMPTPCYHAERVQSALISRGGSYALLTIVCTVAVISTLILVGR